MPGHTFLYSPPVVAIKELIDSGDLGDLYFISSSRVNLGLHQPDVSVVWDLGPHDFSILRYWLGESPSTVSAMSRDCVIPGTPDVAFINLAYASGIVAQVELAWLAPSKLRRTAVVGSERMVVYDDTSGEPVRVFDSGATLPRPGDVRRVPAQLPHGRHRLAARRAGRAAAPCRWRTSAAPFATGRSRVRRQRSAARWSRWSRRSTGRSRQTVPRSTFGRRALRVTRRSSSSGARQRALIDSLPTARSRAVASRGTEPLDAAGTHVGRRRS